MAGGFGTRLRPLTCNLPKPMVPMANRPMMEHIVELLVKHDSYPENIPHYHQRVRLLHIHKNGRIHNDPRFLFSLKNKPLFLRFINTENKKGLENLVELVKDFCIFPNDQDMALLTQQYKNAIGTENYHFLFPMHTPLSQSKKEEEYRAMEAIKKINLDYLWRKKLYLQGLVQSYRRGEMKMLDLSTLYRYMTQVSEVFLDERDFNLKKIHKGMDDEGDGTVSDTRGFDDIIGEQKVQNVKTLVTAYRVYDHFTLCCLELFLTIKNERGIAQCKACKEYYEKSHGSQDYCSPECQKKGATERSRRYRAGKK
jgi:hypothetical protein